MNGLDVVQKLTDEIVKNLDLNFSSLNREVIFNALKSQIVEVSQFVSFDRRSLPEGTEARNDYIQYANKAAFHKMAVEALPQLAHAQSEYDSDRDEQVNTYKVFVVKP